MSEEQKKQLQTQLWNIANELRGKMGADEFRDYILGFIFYKYLSEKLTIFADEILEADKRLYKDLDEQSAKDKAIIDAVKKDAVDSLGFFLKPSELFAYVAEHGAKSGNLISQLEKTLNSIEQSTLGADSEDDFDKLFSEIDLNATKLGKTVSARNELIAKVLKHLNKIDFKLQDSKVDILGDAYEYLIGQFASGAGKKAGEFYTPQEVSSVLAKIVTNGKKQLKNVYDPTCGSGSLLLRVAREVEKVGMFYGQEMNNTTYNLARMNMILHDVNFSQFDIRQEDTLEHPQHAEYRFEAIVANPPFSAKWSSNPLHLQDDRFSQYGVLAPKKPADYAFIQHMLYQLDDNGTMAVVMPLGALSRGKAEYQIRKYLVETKNYLDAVIGLPVNIFFGTESPASIMVFKKCRENPDNVLFIDASHDFDNFGTKNKLRDQDITRIYGTYRDREAVNNYSRLVTIEEILSNDCNLNIYRYINRVDANVEHDLDNLFVSSREIRNKLSTIDKKLMKYFDELGIETLSEDISDEILTGKIRFRDEKGNSFPNWETRKLGDLAKKVITKNVDEKINNVFTNSATKGVIAQRDYFDKDIANQSNLSGYYIVSEDDFIYNPRISIHAPVGPIKRNHLGTGIISPLYSVFRFEESLSRTFYEKYFESSHWHNYMRSVANYGARHDRMNISQIDLYNMPLPYPSPEEQTKIADFLTAIEEKIDLTQKELSIAKQFKQAFLHRVFV